jgi:hypothetical protein
MAPIKRKQVTLEARYFTASSLSLWFSEVLDPGGVFAMLRTLVEELGESNGVKGRSWVGSDTREKIHFIIAPAYKYDRI